MEGFLLAKYVTVSESKRNNYIWLKHIKCVQVWNHNDTEKQNSLFTCGKKQRTNSLFWKLISKTFTLSFLYKLYLRITKELRKKIVFTEVFQLTNEKKIIHQHFASPNDFIIQAMTINGYKHKKRQLDIMYLLREAYMGTYEVIMILFKF